MHKLLSTLAVAALLVGVGGSAQAEEGWYGRADVGYSVDGQVTAFDTDFDLADDWMGDAAIGYGYGNGFRADAEFAYRSNEVDVFSQDVDALSLMANLFYDFNREGRFRPYVGAGLGYARLDFADLDDSSWAWQVMAGLGIGLGERTTLDIGYRHFEATDLEIDLDGPTDVEYAHDAVTVGLRYALGAPAAAPVVAPPPAPPPATPAPAPAPVACPTSEFVVYFEWDRSNLNDAALATIDQAVARARQCNVTATAIVGHTDTSGSTAYNVGLSERRAGIVRDALVARGMSASTMSVQSRGETDLARQTRDGVREPLNRRTAVTITFR